MSATTIHTYDSKTTMDGEVLVLCLIASWSYSWQIQMENPGTSPRAAHLPARPFRWLLAGKLFHRIDLELSLY
jgi:hypothetical protein